VISIGQTEINKQVKTKRDRIPKGQSKMDNPEKLATYREHKTKKNKTKTQHNMCWTPLCTNKHKNLHRHFKDFHTIDDNIFLYRGKKGKVVDWHSTTSTT